MKIILYVLAVMTVVYGFNLERYYRFQWNMCKCRTEWEEKSPINLRQKGISDAELLRCACDKDGGVYDKYNQFISHLTMKLLEDIIGDLKVKTQAQNIFLNCLDEVGGYWYTNVSVCASSIISLII